MTKKQKNNMKSNQHNQTQKKDQSPILMSFKNIDLVNQKHPKETSTALALSSFLVMTTNPQTIAILLLGYSILSTKPLFQISSSSWLPLILILTFSSGMMTLFMYAAALTSNETNKAKKSKKWMFILLLSTSASVSQTETTQESMKTFSSQVPLMIMATFLIMTISTLTVHSHQPFQTLSSSF